VPSPAARTEGEVSDRERVHSYALSWNLTPPTDALNSPTPVACAGCPGAPIAEPSAGTAQVSGPHICLSVPQHPPGKSPGEGVSTGTAHPVAPDSGTSLLGPLQTVMVRPTRVDILTGAYVEAQHRSLAMSALRSLSTFRGAVEADLGCIDHTCYPGGSTPCSAQADAKHADPRRFIDL